MSRFITFILVLLLILALALFLAHQWPVEAPGAPDQDEEKPNLSLYGALEIGEARKRVAWNDTINLTPADAFAITDDGRAAFKLRFRYKEFAGVAIDRPFSTALQYGDESVGQEIAAAMAGGAVHDVETAVYLPLVTDHLSITVDAEGAISETRESDNGPRFIRVRFHDFGDAQVMSPEEELGALSRRISRTLRLSLDQTFYEDGEAVRARLDFAGLDLSDEIMPIHVVTDAGDVELIILRRVAEGRYETYQSRAVLAVGADEPLPHDGRLTAAPGERLFALAFFDPARHDLGVRSLAATAFVEGAPAGDALPEATVMPEAMSEFERAAAGSDAPFGLLMAEGGYPLEVALRQVIFSPNGLYDLDAFLAHSGGTVRAEMPGSHTEDPPLYLVDVPLDSARADRLGVLRAHFGEEAGIIASQPDALKLFALILDYRLHGFAASANPRVQFHGAFSTVETAPPANLADTMMFADNTGNACPAGDESCPLNVQALWAHLALWDFDESEIPVAFLDHGFATANSDFRLPASGEPLWECDLADPIPDCRPGVANTTPTVGASLFGPLVWHGTGSVSVAGGVLNNNWQPGLASTDHAGGAAGPAGQVLVPMLYRYDLDAYAFGLGLGMGLAADQGAACVNVAAGYPCNVRLSLVGDFELCDPNSRDAACQALTLAASNAAAGAAAASCGAATLAGGFLDLIFPGLGSLIGTTVCTAGATAAVTTPVAMSTTCVALHMIGDTRWPMQRGVDRAAERGVPIIASMGNELVMEQVPAVLRDLIDPGTFEMDGDALRMVPATLPGVINVGAAAPDPSAAAATPMQNSQIRGASVSKSIQHWPHHPIGPGSSAGPSASDVASSICRRENSTHFGGWRHGDQDLKWKADLPKSF